MKENKKVTDAYATKLEAKQERPIPTETFDFVKSFIEHIKSIFSKFSKQKPSSLENEEFIALGRSVEEKDQIAEMCHNIDEEYELLADMRSSNLAPEVWLQNKTQEILQDCSDDEQDVIIQTVEEEGEIIALAQAQSLDETINELQKSQNTQTEE